MPFSDKNNPLLKLVNTPVANISDQLFEKMRSLIITGELPAGYVFPIETQLCEQLHVGRSTLREVYKALATSGYITRSKTGTYVNDRKSVICATPLNVSVQYSGANDVYAFRRMLETENAACAAANATAVDLQRIKEALQLQPYAEKDLQTLVKNDIKFHQRIAEATHNTLLLQTMLHMQGIIEKVSIFAFSKALESDMQLQFGDLHQQIYEAIRDRDPESAANIMKRHMEMTVEMLENVRLQTSPLDFNSSQSLL